MAGGMFGRLKMTSRKLTFEGDTLCLRTIELKPYNRKLELVLPDLLVFEALRDLPLQLGSGPTKTYNDRQLGSMGLDCLVPGVHHCLQSFFVFHTLNVFCNRVRRLRELYMKSLVSVSRSTRL